MLKYFKTIGIFRNSTGTCTYNPDTGDAYSYGWWRFALRLPDGRIVFNNYSYSNSTCKHQNKVLGLLSYKTDISVSLSEGLNSDWAEKAIEEKQNKIRELQDLIDKPRTRLSTNQKRQVQISKLRKEIEVIKAI